MKEIQQDQQILSDFFACKLHEFTLISNYYTSSRPLCGDVPVSFTICWPVPVSSATNGDITDMMQRMATSEGRALVSASSWISSDETFTLTRPLLTSLKSHNTTAAF